MARQNNKARPRRYRYTARNADKYELYQLSVQSPEPDIRFMERVYRNERGTLPLHFREDFCGTALLSAEWIRRGPQFTAEGFDIDPEPLEWGRSRHFAALGEAAARAVLHQADVREPSRRRPDVRCAQNFSYFVFKRRAELLDYFRSARGDLADDGLFVLDIHGGPECTEEMEETTRIEGGFTYVWDQHSFSPVTHDTTCFIHFRFRDGSQMRRAFRYDWRLWTIPEIRDTLADAGFRRVDVYWEGTSEDGTGGNGIYRKTRLGSNDPSFVAYLVAVK